MRNWFKCALVRAVKTMAQTMVSLLSVGYIGIFDVDWIGILSASALAGLLSILTSVAGLPEVDEPIELTEEEVLELIEENPELMKEV